MADRPCDSTDGPVKQPKVVTAAVCARCKERKPTFLSRQEPTCWPCFVRSTEKKFVYNVTHHAGVKQRVPKVLFGYSGSIGSAVMLDLFCKMAATLNKKIMVLDATVVHICTHALLHGQSDETTEQCTRNHQMLAEICKAHKFRCEIVDVTDAVAHSPPAGQTKLGLLRDTLFNNTASSGTFREDFLSSITMKLLISTAKRLEIPNIYLANNGTDIAVNMIAGCSKGRGFQLVDSVATSVDSPTLGLRFYQPLKDLLHTDVAYYFHMAKLQKMDAPPPPAALVDKRKNINRLTAEFLISLQSDFGQTITTILRSGDKLASQEVPTTLCPLCLTRVPSREIVDLEGVCYSCKITSKEAGNAGPALEEFIQDSNAKLHLKPRDKLREELKDFILDDSD